MFLNNLKSILPKVLFAGWQNFGSLQVSLKHVQRSTNLFMLPPLCSLFNGFIKIKEIVTKLKMGHLGGLGRGRGRGNEAVFNQFPPPASDTEPLL